MSDNDIIKAVGCCEIKDCHECPYKGYTNCRESVMHGALDLINRQKAENERLQAENEEQDQAIINALHRMGQIRAEAIKEFAERLSTLR